MVEYKMKKNPVDNVTIPDLNWNLLPGTKDLNGWELLGVTATGETDVRGGDTFVKLQYTNDDNNYSCILSPTIHIGDENDYVLSFKIIPYVDFFTTYPLIFLFYEDMGVLTFKATIAWVATDQGAIGIVVIKNFLRIHNRNVRIGIGFNFDSVAPTETIDTAIGAIKLEKGSTVTGWCPTEEEYIEEVTGGYGIVDDVSWNLLPNTDNMTEWEKQSYVTCTRLEYDKPKFRIANTAGSSSYLGIQQAIAPVKGDQQYTISYMATGYHELRLVRKDTWSTNTGLIVQGQSEDVNRRYTVTFTPDELGVSDNVKNDPVIYIYTSNGEHTDISYLKLEKGSIATEWCPTKEEAIEEGEYTEPVNFEIQRLENTNAAAERIRTRLNHTTKDIPYYDRGVDIDLFTYGTPEASLRMALRDFMPNIKIDTQNSRIQYYNIDIDISKIMDGGM
jgi:hypothetical protein